MDAKNGYCSAQLKQAKNLARDGYYDSSIIAVGKGIERLLEELFKELRDKDKSNLIALSVAYDKATSKKIWSRSKNGQRKLKLYGWIKFYQNKEIFCKLEETCGYKFDEFNVDNLHQIRKNRNDYGAHEDEHYDIHRKQSSKLINLYAKMLSETGRIAQPTSIVPFNQFRRNNNNQLALYSNEKSLLKQEFDDVLRSSPDEIDFLFLRAYLLRGENAALDDLERILILNPSHDEARKERNWYRNHRTTEKQVSQQPIFFQNQSNLTQIKQYKIDIKVDVVVAIIVAIVLLVVGKESQNRSYNADLQHLQKAVVNQSAQLENVENELKAKDTMVEALEADLEQLQTTVQTQPVQFVESASDQENQDALTPNLDIRDNPETQHSAQVESLSGALEAFINQIVLPLFAGSIVLLFVVFIFILLAWWIFSRIIFPRLVEWILSQFNLRRLVQWIIRALPLLIRSSVSGLYRRIIPW